MNARASYRLRESELSVALKGMNRWKYETTKRPPYSYIALIALSIHSSRDTKETLSGIYK